jgi:hypothetical protein
MRATQNVVGLTWERVRKLAAAEGYALFRDRLPDGERGFAVPGLGALVLDRGLTPAEACARIGVMVAEGLPKGELVGSRV